ncbi:MAG TPA: hypothetical protein VFU21_13560 [Kofleriaceae bacterium]|nr:hypothetical protein [Kofleriaceae bacterium]
MGGTSGIKMNWPVVAIAFAVIGVPMGVAVVQDLGSDSDEEELLARIGEVNDISAEPPRIGEAELDEGEDEVGAWRQPAMEQAFFDEVFLGGPEENGPAMIQEPDLTRWPRARLEREANEVTVAFPDDGTAARVLASRWGDPLLAVGADDLARRIWVDAGERVRLVLESHDGEARATFGPYVPAAVYVTDSGRFAFETQPILGATRERLAHAYGPRFSMAGEVGKVECPPVELSAKAPICSIDFARGKAAILTVTIDHTFDPQAGPVVFAALRDALGPVRRQASSDLENTWTFDRGITVTQRVGEPVITVMRVAR